MGFTTVVLLVIPLFFKQSSCQKTVLSPTNTTHGHPLPTQCPSSSNGSDAWWTPLRIDRKHDPCHLFHHLSGQDNHRRDHKGHHSPPTASSLQIYNVFAACKACEEFPDNTTAPSAADLDIPDITSSKKVEGKASGESNSLNGLPRWTNTTLGDDNKFNVTEAVRVAISDNTMPSASHPDAGAIAGGVIGGSVFISLVFIAFLIIRRRRLKAQIPPSAEFMYTAGPRTTYNSAPPDGSPPLFEPGEWRDPVMEKVYDAALSQRQFNTGVRSTGSRVSSNVAMGQAV